MRVRRTETPAYLLVRAKIKEFGLHCKRAYNCESFLNVYTGKALGFWHTGYLGLITYSDPQSPRKATLTVECNEEALDTLKPLMAELGVILGCEPEAVLPYKEPVNAATATSR